MGEDMSKILKSLYEKISKNILEGESEIKLVRFYRGDYVILVQDEESVYFGVGNSIINCIKNSQYYCEHNKYDRKYFSLTNFLSGYYNLENINIYNITELREAYIND